MSRQRRRLKSGRQRRYRRRTSGLGDVMIAMIWPGLLMNAVTERLRPKPDGLLGNEDDADELAVRRGDRTRKAPSGERIDRCS
jgi:hypothetical protein